MLEGAKSIGAGAATIASAGAAAGTGNVFSPSIHPVARNPSLAKQSFYFILSDDSESESATPDTEEDLANLDSSELDARFADDPLSDSSEYSLSPGDILSESDSFLSSSSDESVEGEEVISPESPAEEEPAETPEDSGVDGDASDNDE